MIRKPEAEWGRGSDLPDTAREVIRGGAALVDRGGHMIRGVVCWGFALLWGLAALSGGLLGGSLPTLIGVGAMSAGMGWLGNRAFARARGQPSRLGA